MSRRGSSQKHVYDYRIDARGSWICQGNPVQDRDLVCMLSRSLSRDGDGRYQVRCQGEVHPVRVEDAPLLVEGLELDFDEGGGLQGAGLVLADGRVFGLGDTLCISGANRLYALIEETGLEALFGRRAYYELTRHLEQDGQGYYIPLAGERFYISPREERRKE